MASYEVTTEANTAIMKWNAKIQKIDYWHFSNMIKDAKLKKNNV